MPSLRSATLPFNPDLMKTKHSPLPWAATPTYHLEHDLRAHIRTAGANVCSVVSPETLGRSEFESNVAFIVQAVNHHAALVGALEKIVHAWDNCALSRVHSAIDDARAALALALGEGGQK